MQSIDLPSIAVQIAEALSAATGETWTFKSCPHQGVQSRIAGPGELEILISTARTPGRLALYGTFGDLYQHRYCNDPQPEISVSAERPAAAIAREIARRLLPPYREQIAAAQQAKAEHNAARAWERATALRLVQISGGSLYDARNGEFSADIGPVRARGSATSGYGVELELRRLTPEQAERVLIMLAEETTS